MERVIFRNMYNYLKDNNLLYKHQPGFILGHSKKGKRKVQRGPQPQATAPPRHQEEEETDKSKHAQIEQTYEKH